MSDVVEFLLARIAEDEVEIAAGFDFAMFDSSGWMGHAASWDRERALAECEAKRRIVEGYQYLTADPDLRMHAWTFALRCLTLPYADHRDYREEWKP